MSKIIAALPILVIVDPEPVDPDEPGHVAQCPHCLAVGNDILREIDEAIRWNRGELVIENGEIVQADWGTGDGDFHHVRYECEHCDNPVELPGDIEETWS